jgi:DivIVA domain-containing protein
MRKKGKDAGDAQDFTGLPASTVVTPADIQSKEFNVSRFGGYRMRDVDEFLDHITESMTKLSDENERLRTATGLPAAPSIGAPDLADTSRQADEIIERARAEAATIVQDAREQAAAAAGGAVAATAGTDAGRAAVAPFLSQERDFLQQLAALVQSHAESVKGMAKASRAKAPAVPAPATVAAEPAATPPAPANVEPEQPSKASTSDATQPMPPVRTPDAGPPAETGGSSQREAAPPIRVEEPATASVSAGDSDDDAGSGDGGDRTLRELFWGEE